MATVREIIQTKTRELNAAGVPEALLSVEWIVQDELGLSRAGMITHGSDEVDAGSVVRIEEKIARRLRREPVQYIVGYTDFMGNRINVGPGVLIPRPETEELVELALGSVPVDGSGRVLDVGTGSGCIAIAMKVLRPAMDVVAIDVSTRALEIARRNAKLNACEINFVHADATDAALLDKLEQSSFDVVISNPPYISRAESVSLAEEVRAYEPDNALFADDDGTAVFAGSLRNIGSLLKAGGFAYFEVHADRAVAFAAILRRSGFADVVIHKDVFGRDRMLSCRKVD